MHTNLILPALILVLCWKEKKMYNAGLLFKIVQLLPQLYIMLPGAGVQS